MTIHLLIFNARDPLLSALRAFPARYLRIFPIEANFMSPATATLFVGFMGVAVTIVTQLVMWGIFRGKVIARIDATDRRVDELRENQGRIFERLDVHTEDIGYLKGKLNGKSSAAVVRP
jgi:hypothetical protein